MLLPGRAEAASMLSYAIDAIVVSPAQGTRSAPDGSDMRYMLRLLDIIEREGIPAPAPIEQRWTAGSSSLLSPARSTTEDALFSWVGIIMYLPSDDERVRKRIGDAFWRYKGRCESDLWPAYGALEHWAKVEGDSNVQERLKKRLGDDALTRFADARKTYDPQRLLSNPLLDGIFQTK